MIEKAPGFTDQRTNLEPGSLFNPLLLLLQFFMSFMSFMLFQFRLLGKPALHRSSPGHTVTRIEKHEQWTILTSHVSTASVSSLTFPGWRASAPLQREA
jgi:hypothetical protein